MYLRPPNNDPLPSFVNVIVPLGEYTPEIACGFDVGKIAVIDTSYDAAESPIKT